MATNAHVYFLLKNSNTNSMESRIIQLYLLIFYLMVFKILFITKHPLYSSLPQRRVNKSLSTDRNDIFLAFSCMAEGSSKHLYNL